MGIMIILEIIPDKIKNSEWEQVYEEALKLVEAYPFMDKIVIEGLNNKAKVISHRAYGFRTVETYKLTLYHCMGKLPRPESSFKFL